MKLLVAVKENKLKQQMRLAHLHGVDLQILLKNQEIDMVLPYVGYDIKTGKINFGCDDSFFGKLCTLYFGWYYNIRCIDRLDIIIDDFLNSNNIFHGPVNRFSLCEEDVTVSYTLKELKRYMDKGGLLRPACVRLGIDPVIYGNLIEGVNTGNIQLFTGIKGLLIDVFFRFKLFRNTAK